MKTLKTILLAIICCIVCVPHALASHILIPMDLEQENHLKAYGIAYFAVSHQVDMSWLLNYRGGSFMCAYNSTIEDECVVRGVTYQVIADIQAEGILAEISATENNMNEIRLTKEPKIAVYSPKNKLPWDDAVTLVLTYAEIPYTVLYDEEVIKGELPKYDWLHLHHEDFTGQYGKFWANYRNAKWYQDDVKEQEERAAQLGFAKVSQMKLAVAKGIRDFVAGGGYLFAMCSGPDSYDIALAAEGVDICDVMFDGDPMDPQAQSKLNYDNCFAFTNFKIETNPYVYEVSDIDVNPTLHMTNKSNDFFTLFEFSAKWDPVPTMLCQNHLTVIPGFMGQTTAFRKELIKPTVTIMGESAQFNEARYIHGEYGKGTWTFYSGHDPEDYQHLINDPPTELNLFPNSAGYRLILNNVLFPAAKKQQQKT
ncbi:MAG: asparagine synthetase B [Bacteroidales bacterium]|nr:asparagine synthetase B [Bacteroidales bacterium]MCR4857484.1 asparagine synthetase B [Bacteroidales bacterium]